MSLKRKGLWLVQALILGALAWPTPSNASSVSTLKIGDCLKYEASSLFAGTSKGTQVKCANSHNAEVYRVTKFATGTNLPNMTQIDISLFAQKSCLPWNGNSKYLNQWTFRIPTNSEWSKGVRTFYCLAIKTSETPNENGELEVISFKGKKLDFK